MIIELYHEQQNHKIATILVLDEIKKAIEFIEKYISERETMQDSSKDYSVDDLIGSMDDAGIKFQEIFPDKTFRL